MTMRELTAECVRITRDAGRPDAVLVAVQVWYYKDTPEVTYKYYVQNDEHIYAKTPEMLVNLVWAKYATDMPCADNDIVCESKCELG